MTTATFKEEAQRRLLSTWEVMVLLNLKNRVSVHDRVKAGKLPPPILVKDREFSLWDRDELEPYLEKRIG